MFATWSVNIHTCLSCKDFRGSVIGEVMRLFFLTLAVAMFITPAGAEWKVNTYTDPKTNVTMSVATLSRHHSNTHCK